MCAETFEQLRAKRNTVKQVDLYGVKWYRNVYQWRSFVNTTMNMCFLTNVGDDPQRNYQRLK
jgi:hypothetical protein